MTRTGRRAQWRRPAFAGAAALLVLASCGRGGGADEPSGPTIPPDADTIVAASAEAMGEVSSVRFDVTRSGAPVYIDAFESIALNTIVGEFSVPVGAGAAPGRGRRFAHHRTGRDRDRRRGLALQPGHG